MRNLKILLLLLLLNPVTQSKAQGLLGPFDAAKLEAFSGKAINSSLPSGLLQEHKWTLLVFLSPECPLSKNYAIVIQQLADEFASQLQVIGIIPGKSFSTKETRQFAAKYKLQFPLLIDEKMELVKMVQASTTPEAVLLTEKAELIYRGAIDDWAVDLGKKRTKASREYLKDAIKQTVAGIPVIQKINPPVGCLINEF
ncbi:redoxin domain-containing protein [Flavihumibacter sp. CACIAM 22H1]|uniref:redoxin domain-containing protein n=1 Tax=Flavihumibacter sp. CACIAM 22H1 TaxID=1812911 RepID=UPI0007A8C097|nr:redoxin domain-containing protein [Flavihumibacter sp. CACIAM 22H1]KYP13338.1 MAG: hypothetical protein A1D16_03700 [Flavihumibacter sp. CACIAM 22H1]